MRRLTALVLLVLAPGLAGCEVIADAVRSPSLACGDTASDLCREVARLAISRMNRSSTGPITDVILQRYPDCAELGRAMFHSEWKAATACWEVEVRGERSHGGGWIVRYPDGRLEADW